MARRKKRRFSGSPAEHRVEAGRISKQMRKNFTYAREALIRAASAKGTKKQDLCAGALDYMMSGNAAKSAVYRERVWTGKSKRAGNSANRVSESLKHRFRSVCLKHPRTSRTGHW